jgi:hypothetical protein
MSIANTRNSPGLIQKTEKRGFGFSARRGVFITAIFHEKKVSKKEKGDLRRTILCILNELPWAAPGFPQEVDHRHHPTVPRKPSPPPALRSFPLINRHGKRK